MEELGAGEMHNLLGLAGFSQEEIDEMDVNDRRYNVGLYLTGQGDPRRQKAQRRTGRRQTRRGLMIAGLPIEDLGPTFDDLIDPCRPRRPKRKI